MSVQLQLVVVSPRHGFCGVCVCIFVFVVNRRRVERENIMSISELKAAAGSQIHCLYLRNICESASCAELACESSLLNLSSVSE